MAMVTGLIFVCAAVSAQTFMSVVDESMQIGWEFVDSTTLNFTLIVLL